MTLILQETLTDDTLPWRVHNCKLSQQTALFDAPLSLLAQYDTLDESTKARHPLSFEQLKSMNRLMTVTEAATFLGIDGQLFKKAWQIKYIGKMVIFCEPLSLALRLHFSNTSKPTQALYVANVDEAWAIEATNYRFFGLVDVLYKGDETLISVADDELTILKGNSYVALPEAHSLIITNGLNDYQANFAFIQMAMIDQLTSNNSSE